MKNKHIICLFIVLIAIICFVSNRMITSKQEQIEALESVNMSLQEDIDKANTEYDKLNNKYIDKCKELGYNKVINYQDECERVLTIISPIKDVDKYLWFQLYYQVLFDIYNPWLDDLPETPYDVYSEREINMMLKCIETETHDAPFECKVNVANVILNRLDNDKFPTDPVELITQKNQFAYGRDNISQSTIYSLLYAYMIEDTTNGCLAFRSDCSPNKWLGLSKQFTDEVGHTFYK